MAMDKEQIDKYYKAYYKEMIGFAISKGIAKADAHDVVGSAFLKLFGCNMEINNIRAYLYSIIRNEISVYFTKFNCIDLVETNLNATENFAYGLDYYIGYNVISREDRQMLQLYLNGYTSKELGRLLHANPSTVRSRLSKILKILASVNKR